MASFMSGREPRDVRHAVHEAAEAREERQAIHAHFLVVGVHHHLVEEGVHIGAQAGELLQRRTEVAGCHVRVDLGRERLHRGRKPLFLVLREEAVQLLKFSLKCLIQIISRKLVKTLPLTMN